MSQTATAAPSLDARRTNSRGALLVAAFGALLAFLDVTIVNVAFPSIRQSFPQTSLGSLSWVLNSYNIVFAALLVAAGRFADLFGRRRMFNLGILVFTLASAWCAAATSVDMLVAARVLQAVGAALLVPASLALVIEAFSGEHRAHAVGLWGATAAVASGVGPPLGGALVEADNWRLAFLINVPFGIAALVAARRVLVESRAPGRRTLPDLRGTLLQAIAIALVTLGIVQGGDWGWASARVVGTFVGAAAALALFVLSSRRHPVPVLDPKLLRIPTFTIANVVTAVAGMGFYAYMLNNILWLHYVWGYGLLKSGLAVAPGAIVVAVVAGALGKIADERGHKLVAVPGALIWAGAYVWYAQSVGLHPAFLGEWLPGQILSGIGAGATLPILASAALSAVPGGRYAGASAIISSTRQLGAVLGVSLLVVIIGNPTAGNAASVFRDGWYFTVVCFLVVAGGSLLLRRTDATLEVPDEPVGSPLLEVNALDSVTADEPAQVEASSMLARLPDGARQALLAGADVIMLPAGDALFEAGQPTDAIYVVRSGRIEVVMGDTVVRELGQDAVVGELGVLTGARRSATIRARRDSHLLRITPQQWADVVEADTRALHAVAVGLAEHLQRSRVTGEEPEVTPRVVSLVEWGRTDDLPAITDRITRTLRTHLRVVTPGKVEADGLERAELDGERVLLVAEDGDQEWSNFCLRQADWTVLVADATTAPPTSFADRPTYVVLTGGQPSREQLLAWHDAVRPRRIYQTATAGVEQAAASLAARIAGRSLGLAIAGGGARSLAAIGVLEELTANGVEIDRIAGCSVGAAVAALFATGRDAAAVDAACYEEFVRRNPFNDYQLPSTAIARGHKLESAIHRQFGDLLIEELPRELVVVSTDLLKRQLVVHRRGAVGKAVRASVSLPALFPPTRIGDALHVDGGLLDNLPIDPLASTGEGPVVAVNIAAASSTSSRSGPPRMPALGETLLRSLLMAGTTRLDEQRRQAALVVTPDTRGVGLLEFHQIDRVREAGRIAGRAVVEALDSLRGATMVLPEPTPPSDRAISLPQPTGNR